MTFSIHSVPSPRRIESPQQPIARLTLLGLLVLIPMVVWRLRDDFLMPLRLPFQGSGGDINKSHLLFIQQVQLKPGQTYLLHLPALSPANNIAIEGDPLEGDPDLYLASPEGQRRFFSQQNIRKFDNLPPPVLTTVSTRSYLADFPFLADNTTLYSQWSASLGREQVLVEKQHEEASSMLVAVLAATTGFHKDDDDEASSVCRFTIKLSIYQSSHSTFTQLATELHGEEVPVGGSPSYEELTSSLAILSDQQLIALNNYDWLSQQQSAANDLSSFESPDQHDINRADVLRQRRYHDGNTDHDNQDSQKNSRRSRFGQRLLGVLDFSFNLFMDVALDLMV